MRFEGTFRGPHGVFSIRVGDPAFPTGSYVAHGHRVYSRPHYGRGFAHRSRWILVRRYHSRWVVAEQPLVVEQPYSYGDEDYRYGGRGYRYSNRGYRYSNRGYRYSRPYGRNYPAYPRPRFRSDSCVGRE